MKFLLVLAVALAIVSGKSFFSEEFGDGWDSRWVKSTFKGKFIEVTDVHTLTSLEKKGAEAGDLVSENGGVKTATDAKFYQYSATFPSFSNQGKR